jgi:hypothetical protein
MFEPHNLFLPPLKLVKSADGAQFGDCSGYKTRQLQGSQVLDRYGRNSGQGMAVASYIEKDYVTNCDTEKNQKFVLIPLFEGSV